MNKAVRIKNGKVAFIGHFDPISPAFSLGIFLVFLIGRILIDEIADVFVDHRGYPS